MKEFTVAEIAAMLDTNQETVRRWMRNGNLESSIKSRREGRKISEQSLQKFLKSSAKYSGKAATILASSIIGGPVSTAAGIAAIAGASTTEVLLDSLKAENGKAISIPEEYIPRIQEEIRSHETAIQQLDSQIEEKTRMLSELKSEKKEKVRILKQYEYLLEIATRKKKK